MTQHIRSYVPRVPRPKGTGYRDLGNFNAAEPWAGVDLWCDNCKVTWLGCWDNFMCPECEDDTAWSEVMAFRGGRLIEEIERSHDNGETFSMGVSVTAKALIDVLPTHPKGKLHGSGVDTTTYPSEMS